MAKIIDYELHGNVVRFFLGADDCEDYWGDDWDDAPYDCNAGMVYKNFIIGHKDIAFPVGSVVAEPSTNHDGNCFITKEDMKARRTPCVAVLPPERGINCYGDYSYKYNFDTFYAILGDCRAIKFYFDDPMEPSDEIEIYKFEEDKQ